jgi:hypothetical protein
MQKRGNGRALWFGGMLCACALSASSPSVASGDACGGDAGSCFEIRRIPGCSDAACCGAICAEDPFCCDTEWDYLCRQMAVERCAPPVPSNDTAEGALFVAGGVVPFSTIGATDSIEIALPAGCGGIFGDEIRRDVFFTLRSPVTGTLFITTCPYKGADSYSEFDTILLARDPVDGTILSCNDESSVCGGYAEIELSVVAGERLLLQLGGHDAFVGFGAFEVIADGKPAAAPSNDGCKGAAVLGLGKPVAFDLLGATPSASACGADLADVWFRVGPFAESGAVTLSACSDDATVTIEARASCGAEGACAEGTACAAPATLAVEVTEGESLAVRVASLEGAEGSITAEFEPGASCIADFNGDGRVDAVDLGTLLGVWGLPGGDLDGDGTTNAVDLGIVLNAWGVCP